MKTYRGRTEEEQKEFNKRRRQEIARLSKKTVEDVPENPEDDTVEIDIDDIPENTRKQSFKDRIFSKLKTNNDDKEVDKKRVEKSGKFFSHILPMALSGLLAQYSQNMFSEDYKQVSPTKEEFQAVLLPIGAIIGRRIEITTQASQDVIDISASATALVAMFLRMAITRMEIRKAIENAPTSINRRTESGDSQAENIRHFRPHDAETVKPTNGTAGNTDGEYDSQNVGRSEAEIINDLLKRDAQGRAKLGLI